MSPDFGWPHPAIEVPMPNDTALLDLLAEGADNDAALQQKILTDNPAALDGF